MRFFRFLSVGAVLFGKLVAAFRDMRTQRLKVEASTFFLGHAGIGVCRAFFNAEKSIEVDHPRNNYRVEPDDCRRGLAVRHSRGLVFFRKQRHMACRCRLYDRSAAPASQNGRGGMGEATMGEATMGEECRSGSPIS
jgi:hypothetical protein